MKGAHQQEKQLGEAMKKLNSTFILLVFILKYVINFKKDHLYCICSVWSRFTCILWL